MIVFLTILAVYRLTYFVVRENGPYDFMFKARYYITRRSPEWIDINCFDCMSIWVATPFAIFLAWEQWLWLPVFILALSATAMIINTAVERIDNGV